VLGIIAVLVFIGRGRWDQLAAWPPIPRHPISARPVIGRRAPRAWLPWLLLTVVVVAPIGEENALFAGFSVFAAGTALAHECFGP